MVATPKPLVNAVCLGQTKTDLWMAGIYCNINYYIPVCESARNYIEAYQLIEPEGSVRFHQRIRQKI
jgi:hypothetical protein